MLRRLALAALLALAPALASAQFATIAPTAAPGTNNDQIANTAFVAAAVGGGGLPALPNGTIWIGSAGNAATAQTLGGDLTVSNTGVVTFATVNANVGTFGSATTCITTTQNAKGLTTAISAATCTPAVGSITGLGTGVATALAINVGSAGAFTTFNGAHGTPSAITLTNATGLPVSTGISGLGTGVATALAANVNASGGIPSPTPTRAGDIIYWNGSNWVSLAGNNAGTQFLQETAAGVPSWVTVAGTGTVTSVVCNGVTITTSGTCPSAFFPTNCTLAASVAANILTVALKDSTGADASAASPCYIPFRSATAATGSTTFDTVSAALSITTNAVGASLGSISNTAFRFWVVAFDNAGTVVLSLFNASTNSVTVPACAPINEGIVQSSTAISGSATSAGVYYTPNGTTLSSKAIRILGYVEYNSTGLATPGTYASGPNFIETFGPGIKKPCDQLGTILATTSSDDGTGNATVAYVAGPFTGSITPTSAANPILVRAYVNLASSGVNTVHCRVQRSTTWTGANDMIFAGVAGDGPGVTMGIDFPNAIASTTYTVYRKTNNVATTAFCPNVNGGVATMEMTEIQG